MIISDQHKKGPKKPGETRKSPEELYEEPVGQARSANPQQSVRMGEEHQKGHDKREDGRNS